MQLLKYMLISALVVMFGGIGLILLFGELWGAAVYSYIADTTLFAILILLIKEKGS